MIQRIDTYGQARHWGYLGVLERLLYHTVSHLWLDFHIATISLLALRLLSGLYQKGIASVAWRGDDCRSSPLSVE